MDPLTAKLVVADESRTEKTICLAVTPALKAYGLSGRCRLYEVYEKAKEIEYRTGERLDFIIAKPRMNLYMNYSARIYQIYLKYFSPEDIHIYSIDEVFIDVTSYLKLYKMNAYELTITVIRDVLKNTGITATAGISENLFLCKIAMDIMAKHISADSDGVRIAQLSIKDYRQKLWTHTPITDFWGIGKGIANKLSKLNIYTMGDLARKSLINSNILYKTFGIDAEILIDHAWGIEPCTIKHIKGYKTSSKSLSEGQVLPVPYTVDKARIIVREMAEVLSQNLLSKELASNLFSLVICYDKISITESFTGETELDYYGKTVPKNSHGLVHINPHTSSMKKISNGILSIYDRIVKKELYIRRIYVSADNVIHQKDEQLDLFTDSSYQKKQKDLELTMLNIKKKYGKNAILKVGDYAEGATIRDRNNQVGGHEA